MSKSNFSRGIGRGVFDGRYQGYNHPDNMGNYNFSWGSANYHSGKSNHQNFSGSDQKKSNYFTNHEEVSSVNVDNDLQSDKVFVFAKCWKLWEWVNR